MKKIIPYEELSTWLAQQQNLAEPPAIVQCHGVFDLLHIGHIRYLQRARELGDFLLVSITPDRFVNKGPDRPAFPEELRADAVAALDCVDAVVITQSPTAIESLQQVKPRIFAKGAEFRKHSTPELQQELETCSTLGIQVEYIEEVTSSSSELLNRFLTPWPTETLRFLERFRERFSLETFGSLFDKMSQLKVVVIGDSFVDEIYECEALSQSSRAPIVATRYRSHKKYPAGAAAVAGHLASFCQQVDLVTMGEPQLAPLLHSPDQPQSNLYFCEPFQEAADAPIKRRYRESYFSVPMFEINFPPSQSISSTKKTDRVQQLHKLIQEADLVIIWDQAFGILNVDMQQILKEAECADKLAVCVSWDAASGDPKFLANWSKANLFQLGEQELELLTTQPSETLQQKVQACLNSSQHQQLILTRGQHGCWAVGNQDRSLKELPALASKIIDRTGAQEAFFAMAALASVCHAPLEQAAFLGNLAGAQSVAQISTESFLTPDSLRRHLNTVWK